MIRILVKKTKFTEIDPAAYKLASEPRISWVTVDIESDELESAVKSVGDQQFSEVVGAEIISE